MDAQLKTWREALHRIPELGMEEVKTTAYLKKELEAMGYHPQPLLETGLYVYVDAGKQTTLAFRSDIDGLPIIEETKLPFASTHEGVMHACGHDGHMTALLGFAKALKEEKSLPRNILLIFQPAEESPGAARFVVQSGLLEKHHVEAIFGIHLMPQIPEGVIACKPGPLMAKCGEIDVKVTGKGAHAGLAQDGIDSLMIASTLIMQYQQIIARMKSPFEPAIINIGSITGGTARNSVAAVTEFHGTVRCYNDAMFDHLIHAIDQLHKGTEKIYGCTIEWQCPPLYPAVINDEDLFKHLQSIQDVEVLKEPLMLSEDFSYYQKAVKGLFVFVGTGTKEHQSGLHTGTFDFNEQVLEKVITMYCNIVHTYKGDLK